MGDGREVVRSTRERYDVIFSEPSNPYRAGVADLFSQDFYRAVHDRLAPGGIFIHWLQGYEIDADVVRIAYTTLSTVFPHIESWQVDAADLLLIAGRDPIVHDIERLRRRVAREPYRSALRQIWRVEGLEGLYSAFIANAELPRRLERGRVSTDDQPFIEFGFARNVGRSGLFRVESLQALSAFAGTHRPEIDAAEVDWALVEEFRQVRETIDAFTEHRPAELPPDAAARRGAREAYREGDLEMAGAALVSSQGEGPLCQLDRLLVAEVLAERGDPGFESAQAEIAAEAPTEWRLLRARYLWRLGEIPAAAEELVQGFVALRADGWAFRPVVQRALNLAPRLAAESGEVALLFEVLAEPFAVYLFEDLRRIRRFEVALRGDFPEPLRGGPGTVRAARLLGGAFPRPAPRVLRADRPPPRRDSAPGPRTLPLADAAGARAGGISDRLLGDRRRMTTMADEASFPYPYREPMTANDRVWLQDSDVNSMVINSVFTIDRLGAEDAAVLRDLWNERVLQRSDGHYDRFKRRIVYEGRRPYWEDDPDFTLDRHVFLAPPCGADPLALSTRDRLQDYVGSIASQPLPDDRPPWQMQVVPEYRDGMSAVITRIHHTMGDGVALLPVLFSLMDREGEDAAEHAIAMARKIGRRSTVGEAIAASLAGPFLLAQKLMWRGDRSVLRGPELTGAKRVAWTDPLEIDVVKKVKNAFGASFNDVLMACVLGGFERYVASHPGESLNRLRASMPINIRPVDGLPEMGNRFAAVLLSLPVGPRQRPRAGAGGEAQARRPEAFAGAALHLRRRQCDAQDPALEIEPTA